MCDVLGLSGREGERGRGAPAVLRNDVGGAGRWVRRDLQDSGAHGAVLGTATLNGSRAGAAWWHGEEGDTRDVGWDREWPEAEGG